MTTMAAVCDEQAFILGARVSDFENDLHRYIARRMPLARPGPILLALMAAGVKHGDEVVTVAYTFCATAGSILRFGAKPIFVDIKPDSFNIDPAAIETAVTPRTKAVMPVHLFGQCAEMERILPIAADRALPVIEDAAGTHRRPAGLRRRDDQAVLPVSLKHSVCSKAFSL